MVQDGYQPISGHDQGIRVLKKDRVTSGCEPKCHGTKGIGKSGIVKDLRQDASCQDAAITNFPRHLRYPVHNGMCRIHIGLDFLDAPAGKLSAPVS